MLEIRYVATGDLIPYVNNSRTHTEKQVQQLASSIKEFGFTNPVLVDEDGGVIAGHGRLLAAQMLGLGEVPAITLKGLTEAQRKAYVIADNKLALNSGWDDELLKIELDSLTDLDFDLDVLGWDTLPSFAEEIDYSILDDESDGSDDDVQAMQDDVKKALLIEFEADHYPEAVEIVSYWRAQGANVGYMILRYLQSERDKLEPDQ